MGLVRVMILSSFTQLTDQQIIDLAVKHSPNMPLTARGIDQLSIEGSFLSTASIRDRFGTLDDFQVACGFPTKKALLALSNNQLAELGRSISPGKPLTKNAVDELSREGRFPSSTIVRRKFGSMKAFQEACGQSTPENARERDNRTNEEIAEIARRLSPDQPLNRKQIKELSMSDQFVSETTIANRFGGLIQFYVACGWYEDEATARAASRHRVSVEDVM